VNMSVALAEDTPVDLTAIQHELVGRLNTAHQHLEERFTAGAEALMSMMEVIGRLVGTLDRLTNALDGDTASAAMDSIRRTTTALAMLPTRRATAARPFSISPRSAHSSSPKWPRCARSCGTSSPSP